MSQLTFGILSTASVNAYGFLPFVNRVRGVRLLGIASRDLRDAKQYAGKHGIPRAYGSYDELLADPDIRAVYIPLPAGMHREWSLRALEAGKHVLCEKPMAVNAAQAREVAAKAAETGLTFSEGYHYMHHPLFRRILDIAAGAEIGELLCVNAAFGVPLTDKSKVQFNPDLGGGALLDTGCYPVSLARALAGGGPFEVTRARARRTASGVDGSLDAELRFGNGVHARIQCSIEKFVPMHAHIKGSEGGLFVFSPFTPAMPAGPVVVPLYLAVLQKGRRLESVRVPSAVSYERQIRAFRDAVNQGRQPETSAEHGAQVLEILDAIYAAV
jgi:predicted dehydrogenase